MSSPFVVTSSPHLRSNSTTQRIMLDVILALLPALIAGIYFFGWYAAVLTLTTVASCVATEYVTRRFILKRDVRINDLSAVVTGILLAMNLPPHLPLWIAAVGGILAIFLVKELFGGLGQNFMNPALGARVFLFLAWPGAMTTWIAPGTDAVVSATPLAVLKGGEAAAVPLASYADMFFGNVGGCLGETSALALLVGAAYLVFRRVIRLEIPLLYLGIVGVSAWILGGKSGAFTGDFVAHVLSGGLILGAFFMATDYATQPLSTFGKVIYGIGLGVVTIVIRLYTNYPEGVSFAIILMNTLVPIIDRYTRPVAFGGDHA